MHKAIRATKRAIILSSQLTTLRLDDFRSLTMGFHPHSAASAGREPSVWSLTAKMTCRSWSRPLDQWRKCATGLVNTISYKTYQNIKQKIQVLQPVDLQKTASNSSDIFRDCAGGRAEPIACCLPKKILTRPLEFFMISRSGCGKKYTCEPPYIQIYTNMIYLHIHVAIPYIHCVCIYVCIYIYIHTHTRYCGLYVLQGSMLGIAKFSKNGGKIIPKRWPNMAQWGSRKRKNLESPFCKIETAENDHSFLGVSCFWFGSRYGKHFQCWAFELYMNPNLCDLPWKFQAMSEIRKSFCHFSPFQLFVI